MILGGFGVAAGLPAYYFAIKRRAAASLRELLAERFAERACPVSAVRSTRGPVRFYAAYDDISGSGLVLVLGNWRRSRTVYNLVAGLFKPRGEVHWMERVCNQPDVLLATAVEGGCLVVWKGLPSRESVLAHFEAVNRA